MHSYEYDGLRGALSIDGFCKLYGLGRTFAYEQIKAGKLRAVKCGNRTLILRCDAEGWARSLLALGAAK
jgi:excisionase family DNA binding protein